MSYTFDEAVEQTDLLSSFSFGSGLSPEVVKQIIEQLRKEYAPSLLLSKNQYRELKAGHTLEEKIARMKRLADASSDESIDGYINDDMIMRSYLHPETIKVVEEKR